jgi:hypothetical protein
MAMTTPREAELQLSDGGCFKGKGMGKGIREEGKEGKGKGEKGKGKGERRKENALTRGTSWSIITTLEFQTVTHSPSPAP